MLLEVIIYGGSLLLILYYLITKNSNYFKSRGVPYDEPVLFFGSFYETATRKKHLSLKIREIYTKHKTEPYVGIFNFHKPGLMVKDREILKRILVKDFDSFCDRKVASNESADPIAFHNLPSAKNPTWRNLRSKLSPVFTSGKMKLMMPLIKDCTEDLKIFLEKRNGQELNLRVVTKRYSVDVISSCAFGINSNCLKNDKSEILDMATRLLDTSSFVRNLSMMCFFFLPKLVDIFRLSFTDRKAAKYFVKIFSNTADEREKQHIVRNDLIDLLHELKKKEVLVGDHYFDDLKMAAQAITFFSAGNDTTSLTLSFAFYELAVNKAIQDRLRQEILQTFEEHGELTYEAIHGMKYLDMVFKETLRKYPLASFLNREAKHDYTIEETGFVIEKDLSIMIPVAGLHYDPEYFPDPERFNPERFSDENKHKILSYTYMPFGEGPRMCIGERFAVLVSKTALAYAIKDFIFETTESTSVPIELAPGSLFMSDKKGIHLKVCKING